jgi:hypothetical protein
MVADLQYCEENRVSQAMTPTLWQLRKHSSPAIKVHMSRDIKFPN